MEKIQYNKNESISEDWNYAITKSNDTLHLFDINRFGEYIWQRSLPFNDDNLQLMQHEGKNFT